jgi:hypothetical protein
MEKSFKRLLLWTWSSCMMVMCQAYGSVLACAWCMVGAPLVNACPHSWLITCILGSDDEGRLSCCMQLTLSKKRPYRILLHIYVIHHVSSPFLFVSWTFDPSNMDETSCVFQVLRKSGGGTDRNYTAMCTHVRWSVHLSALLEETDCKEDTPLMLPFALFVSLSQLIIVIWIKTSVGITTVFHTGISRAVAAA